MIEYYRFRPVEKDGSLIGFCNFKYNKDFFFSDIPVHRLLKTKGHIKIRLRYPDKIKPEHKIQKEIDEEINAYILANYREALQ